MNSPAKMMDFCRGFFFVALVAVVGSAPQQPPLPSSEELARNGFIGEGTRDLAKALLQGFVGEDENMAYSPLGYSAVLAIFAEGARGESREEIEAALHFPEDPEAVRQAYRSILEKLSVKNVTNGAEFRNYFYVYKNYTVEEDLKDLLNKYYLTEVKSVDRPEDFIKDKEGTTKSGVGSSTDGDTAKIPHGEEAPLVEGSTPGGSRDGDLVAIAKQRSIAHGPILEKNHFSGMTDSALKIKSKGPQSQMIIFNGLYFRGKWKEPFAKKSPEESKAFYKSDKEKITVSTLRSEGEFLYGNVDGLDSKVIEIPYEGDRYSLLLLVPNARDGLSKLIADLAVYPMNEIYKQMKKSLVDLQLPCFEMDSITKPISAFKKLGLSKVTSIFDPEKADLSGVSKDPGLYVEELVQLVSFKVDADYSRTNFLTSSLASVRSNYESFHINHPFLFFLRDKADDIIVVNGKLLDPTPRPDLFAP